MSASTVERVCRLTPLQDGMFFDALRKQDSPEVVYQVCLELAGPVRPDRLRSAWAYAVRRHAMLRTSFHYERLDAPVQVTRAAVDLPWQVLDWRDTPSGEHGDRLAEFLARDRGTPFALTRPPLLRLTLIRTAADRSTLVWSYHHLLLDGWSTYLVLDDVHAAYRQLGQGATPALRPVRPFWEYVRWLQGRDHDAAAAFWTETLRGVTRPTPLGYEEVDAAEPGDYGEVDATLPDRVADGLVRLTRRHQVTMGTVVLAAWALTVSRYSGSPDVVFGTVSSGRSPDFPGLDDMAGLFINVLPVRVVVDDDAGLGGWLGALQRQSARTRDHQFTPLAVTQGCSEVPRSLPLFESLAVFINYPVRQSWLDGGDVEISDVRVVQQPHYPLHLTAITGDEGWRLNLGYDVHRFRASTVRRLADLLCAVLAGFAEDPETVGDLPRWTACPPLASAAAQDGPPAALPADLLRAVAQQRAAGPCLRAGNTAVSYRELLDRAGPLAAALTDAGGAPGSTVDVVVDSPVDRVTCLAAVLLSGAALGAVTTGSPGLAVRPPGQASATTVASHATSDSGLLAAVHTDAALRDPDGRLLTHGGLARLLWWRQRQHPLRGDDLVWSADPRDWLWALLAGATLVTDRERATVVVDRAVPTPPPAALRLLVVRDSVLSPADLSVLDGRIEVREEWRTPGGYVSAGPGRTATADPGVHRRPGPRTVGTAQPGPDGAPPIWPVAAVLGQHRAVREVHVPPDGGSAPVAYLVTDREPPSPAELDDFLAARLGTRWRVGHYVWLAELPRTPGGAVDPAALPRPGAPDGAGHRADDVVQGLVAGLWAEVLDRPATALDPAADFFDLGGHSLAAIRLVSRVRATLCPEFTLNDLFADPTLAGSARAVRAAMTASPGPESAIPRLGLREAPLSFGQERFWYVDQVATGAPNNVLLPSRVAADVAPERLRSALRVLVQRHEVLRTRIVVRAGRPVQVVDPDPAVPLSVDDLSDLPLDAAERDARALLEADVARPFDLSAAAPLRVRLIKLRERDHVVGICLHHIAFDGWSTGVLFAELDAVLAAQARGAAAELPELGPQYADYAVWQRERLRGEHLDRLLSYWRDHLDGAPQTLSLAPPPTGRPATGLGRTHDGFVTADVTAALQALVAEESATPFMATLAAYAALLARVSGQDDLLIGVPSAGRDRPELDRLIGFFVNTLVYRVDLTGRPTFRELVRTMRKRTLDGLGHQELPFERLVAAVRDGGPREAWPLVQVSFAFQSPTEAELTFGGAPARYFPISQDVPRFALTAEVYPWQGGLRCAFRHAVDRYDGAFVARLVDEYVDLVRQLVAEPDRPVGAAPVLVSAAAGLRGIGDDLLSDPAGDAW